MAEPKPGAEPAPALPAAERRRRLKKLRAELEAERACWSRWLTRLKRAFGAFTRSQVRVARIERQIKKLEQAP